MTNDIRLVHLYENVCDVGDSVHDNMRKHDQQYC